MRCVCTSLHLGKPAVLIACHSGSDARTGSVFCVECNDFVYNRQMDEERASAILGAEELETRFQSEHVSLMYLSYANLKNQPPRNLEINTNYGPPIPVNRWC
jgi:hypothetical protein